MLRRSHMADIRFTGELLAHGSCATRRIGDSGGRTGRDEIELYKLQSGQYLVYLTWYSERIIDSVVYAALVYNSTKDYDSWSKQYDSNMRNYQHGLVREKAYHNALGAPEGAAKTPLTNRQIGILKEKNMYAAVN